MADKKADKKVEAKAPAKEDKKEEPLAADYVEDLRPDGTVVLRYTDGRVMPK